MADEVALLVWIVVPLAWENPPVASPSVLAARGMVLAPALRLALTVRVSAALRATVPMVVSGAVLRVMLRVVTPRLPPRVAPLKVVVPLPEVWVTLPVVASVAAKVRIPALVAVREASGVELPTG